MRILVVGAGAIGGYFGGRLAQAGREVTFLVRRRRAEQLAQTRLSIQSPRGDMSIPVRTVLAEDLLEPFDLILLSCKAYDLDGAIESFAPAVGPETMVLPLLNGMRHLDVLQQRFGAQAVLAGLCLISATLDDDGRVLHLGESHSLSFGELDESISKRIEAVSSEFADANFEAQASPTILQLMWEKWVFIATAAGITCLMRSSIGDIVAAGASDLALSLLDESANIAARQGFAPSDAAMQRNRAMFTAAGSPLTASMLRDIERNARTEVDHVIGDLLRRGEPAPPHSLLRIAHANLSAYEVRRARTS